MGNRTRIRWVNVARLGAAAIGCVALVVGLPALLERPKPPPLPDDIGLTQAAGARPTPPVRSAQAPRPARDAAKRDGHGAKPKHASHRERHHSPPTHHHHTRGTPGNDKAPPAPTPVAAPIPPPPPAPAPAPPAPAPSTTYVPPTPAPAATSSPSPPASSSAGADASPPGGPSEFGFEH